MEAYFKSRECSITSTNLYLDGATLPKPQEFDWLIVMGGPMGVHDSESCPWLTAESAFIRAAIDSGKVVIGICLGAQLIAHALGAEVVSNKHREIGWFNIKCAHSPASEIVQSLPDEFSAFHWHGDTFAIPAGAVPVGSSEVCMNQGFIIKDRVVGLQFHLETTEVSAHALIENCASDLDGSRYVQSAVDMLADSNKFKAINHTMNLILEKLEELNP